MRTLIINFTKDERGAIAIMAAFVIILMCLCAGGAIDYARYTNAKSATTAALDTAVLAGARTLLLTGDSAKAIEAATTYYKENVTKRIEVTSDTVQFAISENGTTISGSGNAYLPTTFLKLAGIDQLPLVSDPGTGFPTATMSGGAGDIEVAVMLDVTGSMCQDGVGPCTSGLKLDALKAAAKDLVNIVVLADQSENRSRVALVPFQQRIRVGPTGAGGATMQALTGLPPTWSGWEKECMATEFGGTNPISGGGETGVSGGDYYTCTQWQTVWESDLKIRPCVTERFFDASSTMDMTDDAPGTNAWINAEDGRRYPVSIDSGNNPPTSGTGATQDDPRSHWTYNVNGSCNEPEANEIMPLTSDKNALEFRIDGLVAQHATGGALATAMTWYMLSPNFKNVWPSNAADSYDKLTQLKPNGKPKLRKVAILMSDGVYNTQRGWPNADQQEVSNNAKAVCAAMKAKGIEIYTVGLELDSLSSSERTIAEDTLQSCGSSIEHFYNSFNPEELKSAFRDIGTKLSTISLTR